MSQGRRHFTDEFKGEAVYSALPAGCAYSPYGDLTYYHCYGSWFRLYYGANGTYYDS
jgi:hypothetical protein